MSLDTPERCELLALARASIDATLSPGRSNSNLLPFTATSLPPLPGRMRVASTLRMISASRAKPSTSC